MSAQHTPGPWWVAKSGFPNDRPGVEAPELSLIVWGDSEDARDDAGVCGRTPEEAEANARLIAAAPDLLEALRDVIYSFPKFDRDKHPVIADSLDAARAAIAKATGGAA